MKLVEKYITILLLTAIGYALKRCQGLERVWHGVSLILFYFSIPLTIFFSTAEMLEIDTLLLAILLAFIHMVCVMAISFVLAAKLRGVWITIAVLGSLPNSLFLALPLSEVVLNNVHSVIPHAIAFNGVLIFTIAILERFIDRRGGYNSVIRTLPYLLAFVLAMILRYLELTSQILSLEVVTMVRHVVELVNLSAFMLLGAELEAIKAVLRKEIVYVAILRYLVSPATLMAVLSIFPISLASQTLILGMVIQSLMPPAIMCIPVSRLYNLDRELVALAIAILTPISTLIAMAIPIVIRL